jgi:ABC-type transport system involved in multi-copper enzyme maturation permease subunit
MLKAILRRELMTRLRLRRMMVFLITLATLFGLLVILRWPTDGRVALTGVRSREIFRLFGYGLLATLLLLLPVFPATSIVNEKQRGTLALLFNTQLGAWRIFVGKFLAVLALAGMILAMSLPAAGACYSMGGLSLYRDVLQVYQLLFLVAMQYAAIGLLVSSYAQSIDAAVRLTYAVVLGTSVLPLIPRYFFQGTGGDLANFSELLRCVSPVAALMSITGVDDPGSQGLMTHVDVPGRFTVFSLLCSVVASLWTVSRLNHRIFDVSRAAGTISDDLSRSKRMIRRLFFLVDPQKRSKGIPSYANPVMIKEFRCRRFGRFHWLLRLVAICAVLSLGLTFATTTGTFDWGVETIGGIMVVTQVALIVLLAPSLSAALISVEHENGGWLLLLTTPMSTGSIICGKLLSALLPLLLVLCATMPGYLVMAYIAPGMEEQVKRVVICLVVTAVFAMLLSAAVGSFFRHAAAATATAYAVLLGVCVLPMLVWMGRDAPFGHDTVHAALSLSSIAAAFSVIRMPGFEAYDLIPLNWWILGGISVASLSILLVRTYKLSRPQ